MSNKQPLKDGFYRVELNRTVWEVPNRYQFLSPVGSGAYGQVCSAVDKKTNHKVAIKKLSRPFQSAIHAKRTYRELRMLKHMQHENVIGLLDVFTPTETFEDFDEVYMSTALMGADMNNIIKTQRLSDDHVQFLIYQVLRAMKYIHSAGIIHRDLKPSNIAVNEDCELKILDFGLARHTDDQMTGYVATRWYRAPEIMLNWMHYNQTVDVWSVGCIMAEMLTGKPLFPGTDQYLSRVPKDNVNKLSVTISEVMWDSRIPMDLNMGSQQQQAWSSVTFCVDSPGSLLLANAFHIDQLTKILSLVGSPSEKLLNKISSEEARNYIKQLPVWEKKDFRQVFQGANPHAIDLLERMLDLDADTRITAEQALAHPYLRQYADPTDEPTACKYDQTFEDMEYSIPEWRKLVYDEVMSFQPADEMQVSE